MVKNKLLTLLSPLFIVFFNFLEYGFVWKRLEHFVYPIILTIITLTVLHFPKARKLFLTISLLLFVSMVIFYLFNMLDLANKLGSLGMSLLLITLVAYLPQIIKKGFIKEI